MQYANQQHAQSQTVAVSTDDSFSERNRSNFFICFYQDLEENVVFGEWKPKEQERDWSVLAANYFLFIFCRNEKLSKKLFGFSQNTHAVIKHFLSYFKPFETQATRKISKYNLILKQNIEVFQIYQKKNLLCKLNADQP